MKNRRQPAWHPGAGKQVNKKLLAAVAVCVAQRLRFPGLTLVVLLFAWSCTMGKRKMVMEKESQPLGVIFETDMGNDIDDALALAMLYQYADQGQVRLLAVNSNKDNEYAVRYIDILNTWYGYPDIPIGQVAAGADSDNAARNYAQIVCEYQVDKRPAFKGSLQDYASVPEATAVYRQVLARQPDSSVTIISVGFSTNLARLLKSGPDVSSPLSGRELVARKVKLLSMMAGNFEPRPFAEYNVEKDIAAARTVFEQWPTPLVTSPFEVGNSILYPATSIQQHFAWAVPHPLVVAYESFMPMPYDRPTWDLTAVLYAVEGARGYFNLSKAGIIKVDEKGITSFAEDPAGQHHYLQVTAQQASRIQQRFIQLVPYRPRNRL